MHKPTSNMKVMLCIATALILLFTCCGCAHSVKQVSVTWVDADGAIIDASHVAYDYDPMHRVLPQDTDKWHYTGWFLSRSGDVVVCTATRVEKQHILWKDYDGTILKEDFIIKGEDIPQFDLPDTTERWEYTKWNQSDSSQKITYVAEREPNYDYFVGNVFQIIIKDKAGKPLGSGSGFVINEDGWFITNSHVMDNGYSAVAFLTLRTQMRVANIRS